MSDLVRKEIHDIYGTKNPTKSENIKDLKKNWIKILITF